MLLPTVDALNKITSLFGEKIADYIKYKNIGGKNNHKGSFYEDLFAANAIAKLSVNFFENGNDPFIKSQMMGFVDDFVVLHSINKLSAYQQKISNGIPELIL